MAQRRTLRSRTKFDGDRSEQTFQLPEGGELTVWIVEGRVDAVKLQAAGLNATTLQRFPWAKWLRAAESAFRAHPLLARTGPLASEALDAVDLARRDEEEARTSQRPPPRKRLAPWGTTHSPAFYREVARRYEELVQQVVRNPTATIADERGENRSTVAGWIRRCRQLGLLPPARRGQPG